MDDTCAVCAETLDWVAYGPCGHRDVCSTCIIRLRFICNDKHCCICKSESDIIFVTKALGDYTRMINDFSIFPATPSEGQVGPYWYHEGTETYFDDLDHYKVIKAMCRLSCNVCDKKNEQRNGRSKSLVDFKSIEQLKGHLFHRHRLFMCSLCLEGRKIFISEQKLYNRGQLTQHVKTGDSVVDGSETERAGFMGHPMCEFCQTAFYGDNELYLHMSTEHFTCHLCQRQHPGKYEYYNNYDDLEIHFRQKHFLCEDEACLAKKFIVFASEAERKRHDIKEHGSHLSRSKCNVALQIQTSFQYQRSNEQDRHSRGRDSDPDPSSSQLPMAFEDILDFTDAERCHGSSSHGRTVSHGREQSEIVSTINPFEPLDRSTRAPSSIHHQILGESSGSATTLDTSFPPLPMASSRNQQQSRNEVQGFSGKTMAACLRRQNTVKILNLSGAFPAASHRSNPSISTSRAVSKSGLLSSSSHGASSIKPTAANKYMPSAYASSTQATANGLLISSNFASSSKTSSSTSKANHSASSPNLVDKGTHDKFISDFPPVAALCVDKASTNSQPLLKAEDVQSANKALVEKIRAALDFDEDKYASFKIVSVEYSQDLIDTGEYLAYVHQFGLSHLLLELARLCPSAQKQRELIEIYNYNMRNDSTENCLGTDNSRSKSKKSSRKCKDKCENVEICSSEYILKDGRTGGVMNLKPNDGSSREGPEFLLSNGYTSAKGKAKILVECQVNSNSVMEPASKIVVQSSGDCSKKNDGSGGGGNKPRKKVPKFLKNRLGDSSVSATADTGNSDADTNKLEDKTYGIKDPPEVVPVHGVWRNGGGQRLVAMTRKNRKK